MQFEQPHPDRFRMRRKILPRHGQDVLDADGDQDAVDRLSRPAFLQQVQKREPAFLVAFGVGILGCVTSGRIDQNGFFRKPPVAVACTADAGDRRRSSPPRQGKFQAGIDQRRGLAGARRADDDVPGQIIEIAGLVAAGGLQRRQRILHSLLQHGLVIDRLFGTADAVGDLLCRVAAPEEAESGHAGRRGGEKKDDDVAGDRVLERIPPPDGDQADRRSRRRPPATRARRRTGLLVRSALEACGRSRAIRCVR